MSLEELLPPNQQKYSNIIMVRSSLVVSTLLIALSVPFFGKFMDIFGRTIRLNLYPSLVTNLCFLSFDRTRDGLGWFFAHDACGKGSVYVNSRDV